MIVRFNIDNGKSGLSGMGKVVSEAHDHYILNVSTQEEMTMRIEKVYCAIYYEES